MPLEVVCILLLQSECGGPSTIFCKVTQNLYCASHNLVFALGAPDPVDLKVLPDFPQLGKVVAEIGEENLREISLYSYRILYEVMPDAIYIHGVIHMRRNFKADDLER